MCIILSVEIESVSNGTFFPLTIMFANLLSRTFLWFGRKKGLHANSIVVSSGEVDTSLRGCRVVGVLERLTETRGLP
jgi:hypothetical protein